KSNRIFCFACGTSHVSCLYLGTGEQALNLRCQCIENESRRVGRYLGKVEVYPPNSHCKETEIIATLKKDGQRICLDPNAQWVKRILRRNQKINMLLILSQIHR
uniref:Chemokine interleukin-8-like domain-containing protein n=1 Tax=Neogobius melanostomus TaxID=47308 RepID=A0A8C6UMZ0_9GOBI